MSPDKRMFPMVKSKLKLHGFNNLTKTLSFNIYDICYAETSEDQQHMCSTSMKNTTPSGLHRF